ncbi:hypothetical protein ACTXT7_014007 [Hymenolepis weldensis]
MAQLELEVTLIKRFHMRTRLVQHNTTHLRRRGGSTVCRSNSSFSPLTIIPLPDTRNCTYLLVRKKGDRRRGGGIIERGRWGIRVPRLREIENDYFWRSCRTVTTPRLRGNTAVRASPYHSDKLASGQPRSPPSSHLANFLPTTWVVLVEDACGACVDYAIYLPTSPLACVHIHL